MKENLCHFEFITIFFFLIFPERLMCNSIFQLTFKSKQQIKINLNVKKVHVRLARLSDGHYWVSKILRTIVTLLLNTVNIFIRKK